ncbi:MAG: AAA family ATPase [Bacteroidales bacterium]|nr:AAA family ATPase [Bacteroidales bacterium]MDD3666048.1 AAA family ATPase [Bacteroidales bacterium]
MYNKISELSERAIALTDTGFLRPQLSLLESADRLIGLKGSRGVGKTTVLLQFAKLHLAERKRMYLSLDSPYLAGLNLPDLADEFVKKGGEVLLLDEVHHYENWSLALKFIYDNYRELKVIYTGSSLLHLSKGQGDLSRRSLLHLLPGLSLREFINLTEHTSFPRFTLDEIVAGHVSIAGSIIQQIKPIKKYEEYLQTGYYPFFLESNDTYPFKLIEVINQIIGADLPLLARISYSNVPKIKQLLSVISQSVPFKPNIEKLSGRVGVSKNTLKDYLRYLSDALLISTLYSGEKPVSALTKPEKIYLAHPNLMYSLVGSNLNTGNLRETFFLNQVQVAHEVTYPQLGDFRVDGKYLFEVGGKGKTYRQIANQPNSFIAADDLEIGNGNTVPLWLFGFLY